MDTRTVVAAHPPIATTVPVKVDVVQQPRAFNFFGHKSALLMFFSALVLVEGTFRFCSSTWNAAHINDSNDVRPHFLWDTLAVAGAFEVFMGIFGLAMGGAALMGYAIKRIPAYILFGMTILFGLYITAVWVFYYPSFITKNLANLFINDNAFKAYNAAGMLTAFGYQWMLFGGMAFYAWGVARACEGKVFHSAAYRGAGIGTSVLLTWTGLWMIVLSSIIIHHFNGNLTVQPIASPPFFIVYPGLVLWMGIQTTLLGIYGLVFTAIDYESRENSIPLWVFPILMFFNYVCQLIFLLYVPFIKNDFATSSETLAVLITALNFLPAYCAILERRSASNMFFFEAVNKVRPTA